ncbi:MAG TPA: helix-turn-helix domain-containing protein [Candidatus Eremiobacteraceae bacterium]|nr:helix-turn-helix domain-containing protein [Candidatus Eremiobacteraceae bacterium]
MQSLVAANLTATLERIVQAASADPGAAEGCRRLLQPLERESAERGNDLAATLRNYYACGLRVDKTAEQMFLHRNSVRYRLDRIRSLLRLDIDQPDVISAFSIAFAVRDKPAGQGNEQHAV